jgi:hypothetical protein
MNHFGEILACGHVNVRVIAQRAARECVEALKQFEAMRHDKDDADVRNK